MDSSQSSESFDMLIAFSRNSSSPFKRIEQCLNASLCHRYDVKSSGTYPSEHVNAERTTSASSLNLSGTCAKRKGFTEQAAIINSLSSCSD